MRGRGQGTRQGWAPRITPGRVPLPPLTRVSLAGLRPVAFVFALLCLRACAAAAGWGVRRGGAAASTPPHLAGSGCQWRASRLAWLRMGLEVHPRIHPISKRLCTFGVGRRTKSQLRVYMLYGLVFSFS